MNLLQILTAKCSPNFYNITKSQGKVVRFCLFKQAYRLGEDIVGTFDFSEATVPCVQVKESLSVMLCWNIALCYSQYLTLNETKGCAAVGTTPALHMICNKVWLCRPSFLHFRSVRYPNLFFIFVVLLIIILFCTFSRINLFSFYLFFESRLTPTVFLILGWGYQPEHLQAGIYLLFYFFTGFRKSFQVNVLIAPWITVKHYSVA
jgi:hypothetical protein